MSGVDKEATSYQCPDCGQARAGGECFGCLRWMTLSGAASDIDQGCDLAILLRIAGFQKERVEKAEEEVKRLRGAIDWCIEEGAVLDFFTLQLFHPRVGIKIGGHPPGEYDTFLEAVEGYQKVVEWRRTSLASPRNSLEPPLGDKEE